MYHNNLLWIFSIIHAGSATLLCPATLAVHIIHQKSTITLRLILIILLVDFWVGVVAVGQDTHDGNDYLLSHTISHQLLNFIGQDTDKVQDIHRHFSMHEFQCAVQDMQELLQIVNVRVC